MNDDESNYCVFAHMIGIKKMLQIQARHARTQKCTHSFVPVLNGLKVRMLYGLSLFSREHVIFVYESYGMSHF